MTWTDLPLLAIDTETTGVNPFTDRIVEAAAVRIDPDGEPDGYWSAIIDPGVEVPDGAADVHGITTDRARAEGIDPVTALRLLGGQLWQHIEVYEGQAPVVMYNARFDWPLILAEAGRHGVESFPCFAPIIDPMLLDRMCDRYRKGKRQLTVVADHYGVELGDAAHGAAADATAAGQVLRKIVARFPDLAAETLAGLCLAQVHGAEADRQRFEDYMRRQVDPEFSSAPGWPIPVEVPRS